MFFLFLSLALAGAFAITDQKVIDGLTILKIPIPFYWRGNLVFKNKNLTRLSVLALGILSYQLTTLLLKFGDVLEIKQTLEPHDRGVF
jgi:hypothetical protein